MKSFLIIIFTLTSIFGQSRNTNFEFSGIDQFWEIVNILEANREPSNSDWNKLFNTPGYRILTNGEFTKEFFMHNFRLVFMPKEKSNLEKALSEQQNIIHLKHYIKIKDNKELIREKQKKLQRNREHRSALKKTLEFLPQRRSSSEPPVSFVIFENNGRGSSPIVVDLAATLEWDFVSFLAHEYHHWYRNRQLQIDLSKVSPQETNLVNALSLIEAEGIADMVDKKDWYTKPSSSISNYARIFLQDVQRTPSIIFYIDQALTQISKNPNETAIIGDKIFNVLPQRGHTTGYFMARLILEEYGTRKLTRTVGNPFEFLLLYSNAARKSGGIYPAFSDTSVKYIMELNQKYSLH